MGEMPEWLNAFGAIGDGVAGVTAAFALLAAFAAAIYTARTFRMERSREDRSVARERREQAALVSAWCASRTDVKHASGRSLRGIMLRNASHAPAYDVVIESTYAQRKADDPEPVKPVSIAVVPPGEYFLQEGDKYPWDLPTDAQSLEGLLQPIMNNPKWIVTSLVFTDAHGETWQRDERGRLEPRGRA
ncbi:hypothetical protein [Microbacterium marinilacus]|uniref:Uncharacterized protein n=1 Tax=Microbacterium marinilacus TaxID=415209 RepID=A0ABP7BHK4_9MICO|nr:hypothetical protein [Microbacterium marinilacus]MBY0689555.1 hypothetical protein [Microbacterium marinilacus]